MTETWEWSLSYGRGEQEAAPTCLSTETLLPGSFTRSGLNCRTRDLWSRSLLIYSVHLQLLSRTNQRDQQRRMFVPLKDDFLAKPRQMTRPFNCKENFYLCCSSAKQGIVVIDGFEIRNVGKPWRATNFYGELCRDTMKDSMMFCCKVVQIKKFQIYYVIKRSFQLRILLYASCSIDTEIGVSWLNKFIFLL